ncbi:MAG TPA: hypothetical protein VGQ83_06260 [Polyangia bacterium]|jgi:hypothetical protein
MDVEQEQPPAAAGAAPRRVEVVFETTEASELADLIAREPPVRRRARPLLGVGGALLGAAAGAAVWYGAMRLAQAGVLLPKQDVGTPIYAFGAVGVAVLAALGAAVLGGRGRVSQIAAALCAVAVVVAMRVGWAHLDAAADRARLAAFASTPEFVRPHEQRIAARLRPAVIARSLGDMLGLTAYVVVVLIAWRLPRRPR